MELKQISSLASIYGIDYSLAKRLYQLGYAKDKSLKNAWNDNLISEGSYLSVKNKVKNYTEFYHKFLNIYWTGSYAVVSSFDEIEEHVKISLDEEFHIITFNDEFPLLVKIVNIEENQDIYPLIREDKRSKIIDACWTQKHQIDLLDDTLDLDNLQMFKTLFSLSDRKKLRLLNVIKFIDKVVDLNNLNLLKIVCNSNIQISYQFLTKSFIDFISREYKIKRYEGDVYELSKQDFERVYQSATQDERSDKWRKKPFFKNIAQWNSFDYCLTNIIYSVKKGWRPEHILTSPFLFFTHGSFLEALPNILESNMLVGSPFTVPRDALEKQINDENVKLDPDQYIRLDQYPGVYLNLHEDLSLGMERKDDILNTGGDLIFIISLALLRKRGWHITIPEAYGTIDKLTCDYKSFAEYLSIWSSGTNWGEFVAHYPIPLDYVEAIVCFSDEIKTEIEELVNGRFEVYTVDEFWELPVHKRVKLLYDGGPYSNELPNFCYLNTGEGSGQQSIIPKRNLYCTLRNSGFNKKQAKSLLKQKTYSEIYSMINSMWKDNLLTGKNYYPVIHPPY